MTGLNPAQRHQAKELMSQIIKALVADNNLAREDSLRAKRLISEAAGTLRTRFLEIDVAIKNSACVEELMSGHKAAYHDIVSTLQFEDIVSQIMSHQLERAELSLTILIQIEETLQALDDTTEYQSLLSSLSDQIEDFLSSMSARESVTQQSLRVGEAELF